MKMSSQLFWLCMVNWLLSRLAGWPRLRNNQMHNEILAKVGEDVNCTPNYQRSLLNKLVTTNQN